ncbi:P-loop containing nucleoside triphosphate hydrolase protein [Xylariaceae sp. FL0016]|nr:P-loop containing nucleoside triphosphate hydrolase protein [Xylariaceae sp. FL0016]
MADNNSAVEVQSNDADVEEINVAQDQQKLAASIDQLTLSYVVVKGQQKTINGNNPQAVNALMEKFEEEKKIAQQKPKTDEVDGPAAVPVMESSDDGKVVKGEVCEIKDLFASPKQVCKCCVEWLEDKPYREGDWHAKPAAKAHDAFAIIRRQKAHSGREAWGTDSLVVNSEKIQSALREVFRGYPVPYALDAELTLKPPFQEFCHRWDKFLEVERDEPDALVKKHLGLLRTVLQGEIQGLLDRVDKVKRTGIVEFEDLGAILAPGIIVVSNTEGFLQAAELRGVSLEEDLDWNRKRIPFYDMNVAVTTWNGTDFGIREVKWKIRYFKGCEVLSSLDGAPLDSHPDKEKLRRQLVNRGRKFESLRGQHFKNYSGVASESEYHLSARQVHDRVIIDVEGYYHLKQKAIPKLEPFRSLESKMGGKSAVINAGTPPEAVSCKNGNCDRERLILTDDQCLIATWWTRGLAIRDKNWFCLAVEAIEDINWMPGILDNLVMDRDEKELVTALLKNHPESQSFEDFVPGKGKGMVMLLCGPAGVGKTLTAEAVSENLRRPLYVVGVGDLGTSAWSIEENLKKALRRCARWNAVLLIDEADVFLEAQSSNSLERNELVAVFLRHIEYYQGVMLLTTNRGATIDPAFESRIDIILVFPKLTAEAREQIWRNFLRQPGCRLDLSETDIRELADVPLNGWQIKSAIKTASVFTADDGGLVSLRHLQIVINTRVRALKAMVW